MLINLVNIIIIILNGNFFFERLNVGVIKISQQVAASHHNFMALVFLILTRVFHFSYFFEKKIVI